jgi:hypothetical protein
MMRSVWTCGVLVLAAGCVAAPKEKAPEKAAERTYTQDEEMAAWMAVASPGPEHAKLAAQSGSWTVQSKMWMAPGAPPEEGTGSAQMRMILGGRYQVMDYHGGMMGQPFDGMGLTGYDNYLKKYVASWCDSMGTMIMNQEGVADASGKVVTMRSEFLDPLGRKKHMRMTETTSDADHMLWEMFDVAADGTEHEVMELRYTRNR